MTLREAKNAVREYIRTFTDQKLAEVYAFNADGNMQDWNPCGCLVGSASADKLHHSGRCTSPGHYRNELHVNHLARPAEWGCFRLGEIGDYHKIWLDEELSAGFYYTRQRRRLSAILRAEMRLRDRRLKVSQTTALKAVGV